MDYWRDTVSSANVSGLTQYEVLNILKRDDANFLEGFFYDSDKGHFYESAGLYGESKIQVLQLNEDSLLQDKTHMYQLPSQYFGEGLAPRSDSEFALLTYKSRKIFTVDRDTMQMLNTSYEIPSQLVEGWGFTADENTEVSPSYYRMYASDGTSKIYVIDGRSMKVIDTIRVTMNGRQ